MASNLSKLDLLVIQIEGLHIGDDLVLVAALGIDGEGHKHPLALIEGATENAAVVQALIDNLIERGLDPKVCRLFIIADISSTDDKWLRTLSAEQKLFGGPFSVTGSVSETATGDLSKSLKAGFKQNW